MTQPPRSEAPLRIVQMRVHRRRTGLGEPFVTAAHAVTEVSLIYVGLLTASGITGWGEEAPTTAVTGETGQGIAEALVGPIVAAVVGFDAADLAGMVRRSAAALAGNYVAKAAVEMALHDVVARSAGWSVARLLGSAQVSVATDATVSAGPAAQMAAQAAARAAAGFTVLKLKLGADPAGDTERVLAVRREVGDEVSIRLDANQGWTARQAVALLAELDGKGARIELVEQPVPARDLAGMAFVRQRSPFPILADESVRDSGDVVRVAELGAADAINIKIAKCGGLRAALDMAAVARATGLDIVVGGMMEGPLAVLAAASVAMVVAPGAVHDLDAAFWLEGRGGLRYEDGRLWVGEGEGEGFAWSPEEA
ncbi:MAG: dipeptide epimerase [Acidimicrobiales bacterium]